MMLLWMLLMSAPLAGADRQVLEEVNRHRRAEGLRALAWHEAAAREARRHCAQLLEGRAAEPHAGFDGRAVRLQRAAGAARVAENVFLQEGEVFHARRAVESWLSSEGHRKAVEGPFEMSGVAVRVRNGRVCAVQIFLGQ